MTREIEYHERIIGIFHAGHRLCFRQRSPSASARQTSGSRPRARACARMRSRHSYMHHGHLRRPLTYAGHSLHAADAAGAMRSMMRKKWPATRRRAYIVAARLRDDRFRFVERHILVLARSALDANDDIYQRHRAASGDELDKRIRA